LPDGALCRTGFATPSETFFTCQTGFATPDTLPDGTLCRTRFATPSETFFTCQTGFATPSETFFTCRTGHLSALPDGVCNPSETFVAGIDKTLRTGLQTPSGRVRQGKLRPTESGESGEKITCLFNTLTTPKLCKP